MGVKVFNPQEPPGFKLGDGKWLLKTQQGDVNSQPNTLYKLKDVSFDLIYVLGPILGSVAGMQAYKYLSE